MPPPFVDDDEELGEEGSSLDTVVIRDDKPLFRIPKGKYKGLTLPSVLTVKPDYQQKVDALKADIVRDPEFPRMASGLARTYADLRREVNEKKEALSEAQLRLEAVTQLMTEAFDAEDVGSLTNETTGDNVRVQPEPHMVVVDRDKFRQWVIEAGMERLLSLPWQTGNKITKERLLEGLPEPDGVTAFVRHKVVFREGKK